jgi:hypothetical protein
LRYRFGDFGPVLSGVGLGHLLLEDVRLLALLLVLILQVVLLVPVQWSRWWISTGSELALIDVEAEAR